jgi:hypothetical protein
VPDVTDREHPGRLVSGRHGARSSVQCSARSRPVSR